MIHIIIIIAYALIGIAGSITYFYKQRSIRLPFKKTLAMANFFTVHFVLGIIGVTHFMYEIPATILILCLLFAWLSRIGNGVFVFEHVNATHHVITAILFSAIFLGYYNGI